MVVLISALFMISFIGGFITALYVIKFAKEYFSRNSIEKIPDTEGKEEKKVRNNTPDIISEWFYGEPNKNSDGDINE